MGTSGKTVMDVLKEKHPKPSLVLESTLIHCESLPPLVNVDIASAHIEK